MSRIWCLGVVTAALVHAAAAWAAAVDVLSAGAVEPGLTAVADLFAKETGSTVDLRFGTPVSWRQRIADGAVTGDLLIVPPAVADELSRLGKLKSGTPMRVGRVGVGVAVRDDAPVPDVGTGAAFQRAVLAAETVVYNRASTGTYLDGLFQRLGIAEQVQSRARRYPDGASVMEHLAKGSGREIGLGAITEIQLYRGKGVRYVAPLPAELQNYTTYVAVQLKGARPAARDFANFLANRGGPIMAAHGIE